MAFTVQIPTDGTVQISGAVISVPNYSSAAFANSATAASNTAVVITYAAAGAGISHAIEGIAWSYSGGTTSGSITVLDGTARSVSDGVTATNTALTSATAAFTSADVGKTVSGSGIVNGTKIATVTNATTVVLDTNTTATASGVSVTISPVVFKMNITSEGAGPFLVPAFRGSANSEMKITLAAGGSGVTGCLNVLGKSLA